MHGGAETLLEAHRAFLERGPDRVGPLAIPLVAGQPPLRRRRARARPARALGRARHRLRGRARTRSAPRCSLLREGRADAMIAGGADAPLSPLVIAGYIKVGALTPSDRPPLEASRPFDVGRDGFVMGEGAGVLLLEEREHALARGARIYAELAGYGSSCDAGHPTDPDATGGGPARAMRLASRTPGSTPADIGYVNAHATSTTAGDIAEARAIGARRPRRGGRSPPPSRPTATRSAAPAGSRRSRPSWPSPATRCRRR